jgi:hypothetical protein
MIEQPFNIGDKVRLRSDHYQGKLAFLNDIERTVISVRKSGTCVSGWMISVNGPNAHYKLKRHGLTLDSGWIIKIDTPITEINNTITEKPQTTIVSAFGLTIPDGYIKVVPDSYLEPGDKFYDSTTKQWKTSRAAFSGVQILAGDHPTITYIRKVV